MTITMPAATRNCGAPLPAPTRRTLQPGQVPPLPQLRVYVAADVVAVVQLVVAFTIKAAAAAIGGGTVTATAMVRADGGTKYATAQQTVNVDTSTAVWERLTRAATAAATVTATATRAVGLTATTATAITATATQAPRTRTTAAQAATVTATADVLAIGGVVPVDANQATTVTATATATPRIAITAAGTAETTATATRLPRIAVTATQTAVGTATAVAVGRIALTATAAATVTASATVQPQLQPDAFAYYPNIATSLQVPQPSGGWTGVTIAAIWNSGLPDGDIFAPDTDGWLKIQQAGGRAYGLASNGSNFPWNLNNNQPTQSRNQVIVTRTTTGCSALVNGVSSSVNVAANPLNMVMKVRSSATQLRAVALWNRALTPAEQAQAIAWLDTQAPA